MSMTASPEAGLRLNLRVASVDTSVRRVAQFELRKLDDGPLPAFTPGAHVDLRLPGGLQRSYSLANSVAERHRYVIAVQRERQGRGGSAWLHDMAKEGTAIEVGQPANRFALTEDAKHSILIAGGIGITPLWCMVQRLHALGNDWTLHYRARSRESASFLAELRRPTYHDRTHVSFSDDGAARLDIPSIVKGAKKGTHFYCCGPSSMLTAFQEACVDLDPSFVHLERFGSEQDAARDGGFQLVLQRSNAVVDVQPGQTILAAVQARGIDVPSSCQQGVCGACETRVIEGTPDHRDLVLSDAEKATGATMMICCSGARTPRLVLDL